MKMTKIFSVVLVIHALLIAVLLIQPGCKTTPDESAQGQGDDASSRAGSLPTPDSGSKGWLHPDFNAGLDTGNSGMASSARGRYPPTRPTWSFEPTWRGDGDVIEPLDGETTQGKEIEGRTYVVAPSDSLWAISRREGVSLDELLEANGFTRATTIYVGQSIIIPQISGRAPGMPSTMPSGGHAGQIHFVQPGDTLSQLAWSYETTVAALRSVNGLDSDAIQVGQELRLPAGARAAPVSTPIPKPVSMPSAPRTAIEGGIDHIVQPGETPSGIAQHYGMTANELMEINGITDPTRLHVGQVLQVRVLRATAARTVTVPSAALPERVRGEVTLTPGIEELERSLLEEIEFEGIPVVPIETDIGNGQSGAP